MSSYFSVVYRDLVKSITPVLLRKPKMLAWLNVLVSPIEWLYDAFRLNRLNNLYYLTHNSQVYSMEAVLNDAFDADQRRIYISDISYPEAVWLYLAAELRPVPLYTEAEDLPVILFTAEEIAAADEADVFVINVPNDIAHAPGYSRARIRALIEKYRLPSMSTYSIVTF